MNPSTVAEQATSAPDNLFSAFRERRASNRRWIFVVVVPLFGALAAWASMQGQPEMVRIITPNGIRAVSVGMSQQDVVGQLGRPIGKEMRAGGMECFQHGMFSLVEPVTTVYTVCYQGGVLKEVSSRRYSMWQADPDGTFIPAGIPFGDSPSPEKPAPAPAP
ncbi:hypothetical protein [Hyalangium rubrum]|uniref:Lipoprotein SmpA/OmlA domain-containing protein n=1 Tax=Hyalangium rubrum TaxID=3103134 RepID=A0ABU5HJ69_9BACT|nr:hypothetical protein [Hyalangium sp. s54d21]MDY7232934.1 hypothetical protein [Hyalangium sp. s54d21]